MVYHSLAEIDFALDDLPQIPGPTQVLLTEPTYFAVHYVINPHMAGNIGEVDSQEAHRQWWALQSTYQNLGIKTHTAAGVADLYDMVFCANQTLPFRTPASQQGVVLGQMYAEERRSEVEHFDRFFRQAGYQVATLLPDSAFAFEGMGDAIWHPNRFLLWGGYGYRTDPTAYDVLADLLDVHILALHLTDADFYHLDTCFCVLDERTVLIYPRAFAPEALALIQHFFDEVLEAPEDEARTLFACNAHCPDGHHVIIQQGCTATNQLLCEAGFLPIE
ncbi:MAG TPA: arginine deiminase family protein, partial [Rhodothermales bacterium]|nr:arginine deiminase family protein [Rhodothermales bacterium]